MKTRSTTVIGVKKDGKIAIAADGQVTFGETIVMKHSAKKVRKLAQGKVICGFAGSVADAQALIDRLERKLEAYGGAFRKSAIEFTKEWRTDKTLRQLNAMMIAADKDELLLISGDGNVLEPDDDVAGIGSGGAYALSAARALMKHTSLSAEEIAKEALKIAADICIYTNCSIHIELIG